MKKIVKCILPIVSSAALAAPVLISCGGENIIKPERVVISDVNLTLEETESKDLSAYVVPAKAPQDIVWSSKNEAIAAVNPKTGKVTAMSQGSTTIIAKCKDYNVQAVCNVTVNQKTHHFVKISDESDSDNFDIETPQITLNQDLNIGYSILKPEQASLDPISSWIQIGNEQYELTNFDYVNNNILIPAEDVTDYDITVCLKPTVTLEPYIEYDGALDLNSPTDTIRVNNFKLVNATLSELTSFSQSFIHDIWDLGLEYKKTSEHTFDLVVTEPAYEVGDYQDGFHFEYIYHGKSYTKDIDDFYLHFCKDVAPLTCTYDDTIWSTLEVPPYIPLAEGLCLSAKLDDEWYKKYEGAIRDEKIKLDIKVKFDGGDVQRGDEYDYDESDFKNGELNLTIIGGHYMHSVDITIDLLFDATYNVDFICGEGLYLWGPETGTFGEVYEAEYSWDYGPVWVTDIYVCAKHDELGKVWYEDVDYEVVEVTDDTIKIIVNSFADEIRICITNIEADEEQEIEGTLGIYTNTVSLFNCSNDNYHFEYSYDGSNWTTYTKNNPILLPVGTNFYLRGNNPDGFADAYENHYLNFCSKSFNLNGDCSKIIGPNVQQLPDGAFQNLFRDTSVKNISSNFLPFTTLSPYCCKGMFEGCTSLQTVPNFKATTLGTSCCDSMFRGCSSIYSAKEILLEATELEPYCYAHMFQECSSLELTPILPAETLVDYCYEQMFMDCQSLYIYENIDPGFAYLIFVCPGYSEGDHFVTQMFAGTANTSICDPIEFRPYYCPEPQYINL